MSAGWIEVLRQECERTSQRVVAQRIGYSNTVVNQILNGTYPCDTARVQEAVEGALMNATVDCPVLGEISRARCIAYQRMPFRPTNPTNVTLYRTCPTCVHNLKYSEMPQPTSVDPSADQPAVSNNSGNAGAGQSAVRVSTRVTASTDRRKRSTFPATTRTRA